MKTKKDIRVNIVMVDGFALPLVEIYYLDQDAQEHSGLMLVDSGSSENVLSAEVEKAMVFPLKKKTKINSLNKQTTTANNVKFGFVLGGMQCKERFCVCNIANIPNMEGGLRMIGILGHQFMQKHNLVIDFGCMSLHNHTATPSNLPLADCDYFFPMEMGLKYFNIPVLPLIQNGKEIVALADSGATNNLIAKQTVEDNEFKCLFLDENDTMNYLGGSVDVEKAYLKFCLATWMEGRDGLTPVPSHDYFNVVPDYIYAYPEGTCDEGGNPLPPCEALISAHYMAKKGWVLDFGAKIIYKRKNRQGLLGLSMS